MKILPNGFFALTMEAKDLTAGIKAHGTQPRNEKGWATMAGVRGKDGALERLYSSTFPTFPYDAIDLSNFPWPQVFRLDKHIIVCNQTSIYEYTASSGWITGLTGITSSTHPWQVTSSYDWIYLTNGKVAVIRNPETNTYSVDSSAPVGLGVCNYNGQIIVGDQNLN